VVKGEFFQTNDCGKQVDPGAHCTITVKFHPRNKGLLNGTITVSDNAPGNPQQVPLTGTGTFVARVPSSVHFGTQPVGTRSVAKAIRLTNKGFSTVNIQSISITGTDSGDFAETNNCGTQIATGASCYIKATFKPLQKGERKAEVSVNDDGGGSPQQIGLNGLGTRR
jgi:two-component sensor histidine kinase